MSRPKVKTVPAPRKLPPSVAVGDLLRPGARIRTSYGTGPYIVEHVSGPCRCASYLDTINGVKGLAALSDKHFHVVMRHAHHAEATGRQRGVKCYLNGYRPDGTSVWSDDRIELAP